MRSPARPPPPLPLNPALSPHPTPPPPTPSLLLHPADLPYQALQVLVATGVFLVLLAFVGCLGVFYNAKAGGRYLLGCYAFFMILVMIMEFSASLAVFAFLGKLDNTVVPTETLGVRGVGGRHSVRRAPLPLPSTSSLIRTHCHCCPPPTHAPAPRSQ